MGIVVSSDDFDTFNLLKDLEKARDDLYQTHNTKPMGPQTELVEAAHGNNENLAIDWLNDESSEADDFILVESREKKRENRKSLKISPNAKGKLKARKILGTIDLEEESLVLLSPIKILRK